ncbi:MAG: hypothetical protein V7782_15955, partial [Psychromonas sp.]
MKLSKVDVDHEVIALIESQKMALEEQYANPVVSWNKDGTPRSWFNDDVWDFNQYNEEQHSTPSLYRITWNKYKHNPSLLNDLKRRVLLIMGEDTDDLNIERIVITKKSICAQAGQVEKILRTFIDTNIHNMAVFSHPVIFEMLKDKIVDAKLGSQTIEGMLTAFSMLEYANPHLPENEQLIFDFDRNKLAASLSNGSSKGATPVVIPEVYSTALNRLIYTIEDAHQNIKTLADTREYAKVKSITEFEAYKEKKYITGICFMTLMAFSGMRISEVVRLHRNSYFTINALGIEIPVLKSATIKLEGGNERQDIWCCAPICRTAIELLKLLWETERDDSNDILTLPVYSFLSNGKISKILKSRVLTTAGVTGLTLIASN